MGANFSSIAPGQELAPMGRSYGLMCVSIPEAADGGDALGAVLAGLREVLWREATDGVERQ